MRYAITTIVDREFASTLTDVRAALASQGFGVLTEIDMAATLKAKLDVDLPAQVILGACNPPLAHRALQAEPAIGLLLPCNVVVRSVGPGRTLVEAVDPQIMVGVTGNAELRAVADDAAARLGAALDSLTGGPAGVSGSPA